VCPYCKQMSSAPTYGSSSTNTSPAQRGQPCKNPLIALSLLRPATRRRSEGSGRAYARASGAWPGVGWAFGGAGPSAFRRRVRRGPAGRACGPRR
jgi:hypothetical protein